MDERELFTLRMPVGNKVYYFSAKKTDDGNKYLRIIEKTTSPEVKQNIIDIGKEDLNLFLNALTKIIDLMKEGESTKISKIEQIKLRYPKAFKKWTEEDDNRLIEEYNNGKGINELSIMFQRGAGAISARLQKLGLVQYAKEDAEHLE